MKKQKNEKLKELLFIFAIIFFSTIVLILPYFFRFLNGNSSFVSGNSYYYLISSKIISAAQFSITTVFDYDLYTYLISILNYINPWLLKFFPIILGNLSALFFYFILKKSGFKGLNLSLFIILLISSPAFIYTFSSLNSFSLLITLNLLGFLLFLYNKRISFLVFMLLPFINWFCGFVSLILLYAFLSTQKEYFQGKKFDFYLILFPVLIVEIMLFFLIRPTLYSFFNSHATLNDFLIFLGAEPGFSVPIILLLILGLMIYWKKKNIIFNFLLLLLSILSFFTVLIREYLNFIFVVYAGIAVSFLIKRKWRLLSIKRTTLLLVICSLLLSLISGINALVNTEPSTHLIDSLLFLKNETSTNNFVLSDASKGFIITYYSGKPAFINENSYLDENYSTLLNISETIYDSRNLPLTEELLTKNNISFILIDSNLNSYLEGKGVLFLLKSSDKFIRIYYSKDVEIWMYAKEENELKK